MTEFNYKHIRIITILLCPVGLIISSTTAQAQSELTPTNTLSSSTAYITVTYIEPINVRTGPGSFDYPIVGSLQPGETATAIGRSPAGEWIQIIYETAPTGKGWIYAPNVTLSPGALLPIIEPPPTKMPDEMLTPNATFAAEFVTEITPTRMPTFTQAPPINIPVFQNSSGLVKSNGLSAWFIFILSITGVFAFVVSKIGKK